MEKQRPRGVTYIGVLMAISGTIGIVLGTLFVESPRYVARFLGEDPSTYEPDIIDMILAVGFTMPLAILIIVVAFGVFVGKKCAWKTSLVVSCIGIAGNIYSITTGVNTVWGIVFFAIILYYLFKPDVKAYFGKVASPTI